MFSLYLTLKFIHVAAVIAWVGGIFAITLFTLRAGRSPDTATLRVAIGEAIFYGQKVVGPSSGVAILAGITMVITSRIGFMTPWVMWGISGFLLHVILGVTVLRKNGERLLGLANAPKVDTTAIAAAMQRQRTIATLYLLIMLSTVWAMVAKPTF